MKRIYIATIHPNDSPILLKHRFSKKYRHASLDSSLTKARIGAEVRAIIRCLKSGIGVSGIRLVDEYNGLLGLEFIEGKSVRQILPGTDDDEDEDEGGDDGYGEEEGKDEKWNIEEEQAKEFSVTHG